MIVKTFDALQAYEKFMTQYKITPLRTSKGQDAEQKVRGLLHGNVGKSGLNKTHVIIHYENTTIIKIEYEIQANHTHKQVLYEFNH